MTPPSGRRPAPILVGPQTLSFDWRGATEAVQKLQRADPGRPRGLAAYSEWKNPNAEWEYAFPGVIWGNDWQGNGPRLAFFTEGQPGYSGILVQLFAGAGPPRLAQSCEQWSNPPGSRGVTYLNLKSSQPLEEQLAAAGPAVANLRRPILSVGELPLSALAEFRRALAGQPGSGWLRVVPVGTDPQGGLVPIACVDRPAGWVKLDFGPSPNQQLASVILDVHQANAAMSQGYEKALQAHLQDSGGGRKSPLLVSLVGYAPPGRRASYLVARTPIEGASQFKINSDIAGWPDKYREGWVNGCAYSSDGFYQAALLKRHQMPDTAWEWVVFTADAWAGIYQLLQGVLVNGFAYVTTGGECPFHDPTAANPDPSKACAAYQKGLRAGLHYAMSSVGLPAELPSSSNLADQGTGYLASLAVGYALSDLPLSQELVDKAQSGGEELGKLIGQEILQASEIGRCPQPADSLEDAREKGYDSWDPITRCARRTGSWLNFGKLAPAALGDTWTGVAWVQVRPNPSYTGVASTVRISIDTEFAGPLSAAHLPPAFLKAASGSLGKLRPLVAAIPPLEIDASKVPPEGFKIPIFVRFPEEDWLAVAQRMEGRSDHAFTPQWDLDTARNAWRTALSEVRGGLQVHVSYRFTDDPQLLNPCVQTQTAGKICSHFSGTATAKAGGLGGTLSRVDANFPYGVAPTPPPCPGFERDFFQESGMPAGVRSLVTRDDF